MSRPLVEALLGRPVDITPVWVMRQAGRHLPEYRRLRADYSFVDAVGDPEIAAEITLQPVRRYGMDGAVIFADIMTPLQALGVGVEFAPGPKLRPHTLAEVAALGRLQPQSVAPVLGTIRLVREAVPDECAVVGFSGSPVTLLAYLLEGGGSKDFMRMRAALAAEPTLAAEALGVLAVAMHDYLGLQIEAGADAVQLFDSWVGVLGRTDISEFAMPAARSVLSGLKAPTIYFGPHAPHGLDLFSTIGATAYGIDWRTSLTDAGRLLPDHPLQGNLDPAVLFADPDDIRSAVKRVLADAADLPGHVFNLGHGIDQHTDPDHVSAMVEAVRS